jgi:hypothetical protein
MPPSLGVDGVLMKEGGGGVEGSKEVAIMAEMRALQQ